MEPICSKKLELIAAVEREFESGKGLSSGQLSDPAAYWDVPRR